MEVRNAVILVNKAWLLTPRTAHFFPDTDEKESQVTADGDDVETERRLHSVNNIARILDIHFNASGFHTL